MLIDSSTDSTSPQVYKVLIVEDLEADFELYQKFFQKDAVYVYELHYAETASEGLEAFSTHSFDFALIDFSLPDRDGLDLIESIKKVEKYPALPIIMLTGQGNEAIALAAMKKNIQDYFIKGDLTYTKFINGIYRVITIIESHKVRSEDDHTINVLVVENSTAGLELYKRFLSKDPESSFNVYGVTSAKSALEFITKKVVDVVLTDYKLPDANGIDLIQSLKKIPNFKNTCVVMMTAHGSEKIVVEAMQSGASDYLVKQFITPNSLRKTIKENVEKTHLDFQIAEIQFQKNILSAINLSIRESLELEDIIQSSVIQVKDYLKCDRVLIYQIDDNGEGIIVGEAVNEPFRELLGFKISDTFLQARENHDDYIYNCCQQIVNNIEAENLSDCHYELLKRFQVKSIISAPLILPNSATPFWGLLIAHFCKEPHFWKQSEIACLNEISLQVSIGIQQGLLVKELKQERDRAKAATQAKSTFLANMSHEIRTPMNGILGMAELLSLSDLKKEEQDYVNTILSSGKNLLNLINDILDLSKLESEGLKLDLIEFVLRDVVEEILLLFRVLVEKKDLVVQLNIANDLPIRYVGDPYRLKQILINLLGNAIKFTLKGSVTIHVSRANVDPAIAPKDDREIELYFAIKDTGIGITPKDQERLFQPFSQVENSQTKRFSGTGLGLSICKKLVNLMDGRIGVESEQDGGSKFWFTAKVATIEEASVPLRAGQTKMINSDSMAISQEKILLVEDNLVNQKVVQSQLRRIGYECDIAENGKLAIEMLEQNSYILVLMDCQMPVLNGYDTTRKIRQNKATEDLIIVGLTAFAMASDREKCLDAGMNDYLTKPCSMADMQAVLTQWIPVE